MASHLLEIQVESVEQLLHSNQEFAKELMMSRSWKDEELLKLSDQYLDDTHKTINFCATTVQEYLNSANNVYLSLIQNGERSSSPLNLNILHHRLFDHLAPLYRQQLLTRDSLQSFQNGLAQKLHRARAWTKVSAIAFVAVAVVLISAAAAAAAITRKPAVVAATAAAPILVAALERWTHSLLRKYKDSVKNHVEIIGVMAFGTKITINGLSSLHSSARRFEFQTMSASEMAESSADAGEVRRKLTESLQELQGKAADFCRDIRLARACALQSVIKHLDSLTSWGS